MICTITITTQRQPPAIQQEATEDAPSIKQPQRDITHQHQHPTRNQKRQQHPEIHPLTQAYNGQRRTDTNRQTQRQQRNNHPTVHTENRQIRYPNNTDQDNQFFIPYPTDFQFANQQPNFTHPNRFACLDPTDSFNTQNGEY